MRITILALFITLPAAAYGTVYPRQSSLEPKDECAETGQLCRENSDCCSVIDLCVDVSQSLQVDTAVKVRLVTPFALIHVWVLSFI